MKKIAVAFTIILSVYHACATNSRPTFKNYEVRVDTIKRMIILDYVVKDPDNKQLETSFRVSLDGGRSFFSPAPSSLTGDIGFPVKRNRKCRLLWEYGEEVQIETCLIRLTVDDLEQVEIQTLVQEVDSSRLKKTIAAIEGDRNDDSSQAKSHLQKVRQYVSRSFTDHNLTLDSSSIAVNKDEMSILWNKFKLDYENLFPKSGVAVSQNLIGTLHGLQSAETYQVTAHYDTDSGSPGLDDNASGVAGMVVAMSVLSHYDFDKTIQFIGFDKEEVGLIGSLSYIFYPPVARTHELNGTINLDMIGFYSKEPNTQNIPDGFGQLYPDVVSSIKKNENRGDFVLNTYNTASKYLDSTFRSSAARFVSPLKVVSISAQPIGSDYISDLLSSDHASFWYGQYPAIHVGEGGPTRNPHIHSRRDSSDYIALDYDFMANIVKTVVASICQLGHIRHSTSIYLRL